jgi:hypothetical protein
MTTDQLLSEIAAGESIYLVQAAKLLPAHRQGKPVTLSCLIRWISPGVLGPSGERIKLEAARLAGKWVTTRAALARFVAAQTPTLALESGPPPRSAAARTRTSERVAKQLETLGI